jgi:hypothetical protein
MAKKLSTGVGRIRTNLELTELYKTPDLTVDIKRLELFRYVIRMDQTRVTKNIF